MSRNYLLKMAGPLVCGHTALGMPFSFHVLIGATVGDASIPILAPVWLSFGSNFIRSVNYVLVMRIQC